MILSFFYSAAFTGERDTNYLKWVKKILSERFFICSLIKLVFHWNLLRELQWKADMKQTIKHITMENSEWRFLLEAEEEEELHHYETLFSIVVVVLCETNKSMYLHWKTSIFSFSSLFTNFLKGWKWRWKIDPLGPDKYLFFFRFHLTNSTTWSSVDGKSKLMFLLTSSFHHDWDKIYLTPLKHHPIKTPKIVHSRNHKKFHPIYMLKS